jgi:hypothetical protein
MRQLFEEIAETKTGDKMNQDQNQQNAPPPSHRHEKCLFDLSGREIDNLEGDKLARQFRQEVRNERQT